MYQLFNLTPTVASPVALSPRWLSIRDGLRRNLVTAISYYRTNPTVVKGDHLLVKLLNAINVPYSLPAERYVDVVSAKSEDLSMVFKLTSARYKGQAFTPGPFYGPRVAELIISHQESFNPWEAEARWPELSPVRVLRHPVTNLGLQLPDGVERNSESGFSVVAVNIPLLALQHRTWLLAEAARVAETGESPKTTAHFLRQYVIPNMLVSHLDYLIFNRTDYLTKDLPLGHALTKHSFAMIDYAPRLDPVLLELIRYLRSSTRTWGGMLDTIPGVTRRNLARTLELPRIPRTRQVEWALAVARLPALDWLMSVSKIAPRTRNGAEVNRLLRRLKAYENEAIWNQSLSGGAKLIVMDELTAVKEKASRT